MAPPEGSMTLKGCLFLPKHLDFLADLQERYYAALQEPRKVRHVLTAAIQREARTKIQASKETEFRRKLSTQEKVQLSNGVERWFSLFCKKRTSKEKIGTRNWSARDVFRVDYAESVAEKLEEMRKEEGFGEDQVVGARQRAITILMKDLSEEELKDLQMKAAVWSNMGPPYEVRLERGKLIYHKRNHAHALDMYRQGLVRMLIFTAWQTPDGQVWTSKLDYNNEMDGAPRFLDLKKEEYKATGMDLVWKDYARVCFPTDGGDPTRDTNMKGTRKARLLLELNEYGEPILPNPHNPPPLCPNARSWRVDLARAYFSHWWGRASGKIQANVTVQWSVVSKAGRKFVAEIYIPDHLIDHFGEPSGMRDGPLLEILDFIYKRQEAGEDPVFEFHQWATRQGQIFVRHPRQLMSAKEMLLLQGSGLDRKGDEGDGEVEKGAESGPSSRKGRRKARKSEGGSGKGGKGNPRKKSQRHQPDPSPDEEEIDLSGVQGSSSEDDEVDKGGKGKGKEKGSAGKRGKGNVKRKSQRHQPDPPKDEEEIDSRGFQRSDDQESSSDDDSSDDGGRAPTPELARGLPSRDSPIPAKSSSSEPSSSTARPPTKRPSPSDSKPSTKSGSKLNTSASDPKSPSRHAPVRMVDSSHKPEPKDQDTLDPAVEDKPEPEDQDTLDPTVEDSHPKPEPEEDQSPIRRPLMTFGSSPTPVPKSLVVTGAQQKLPIPDITIGSKSSFTFEFPLSGEDKDVEWDLSGYVPGPRTRWRKDPLMNRNQPRHPEISPGKRSPEKASEPPMTSGSDVNLDSVLGKRDALSPIQEEDEGDGGGGGQASKRRRGEDGTAITPRGQGTIQENHKPPKPRPRPSVRSEGRAGSSQAQVDETFDLARRKIRFVQETKRYTSTRSFKPPSHSTRSKTSSKDKK